MLHEVKNILTKHTFIEIDNHFIYLLLYEFLSSRVPRRKI